MEVPDRELELEFFKKLHQEHINAIPFSSSQTDSEIEEIRKSLPVLVHSHDGQSISYLDCQPAILGSKDLSYTTNNSDHNSTQGTSSSSSLSPVFPDDLLDSPDYDPLVLECNENVLSQCSSQETTDWNFITQNSEDRNREPCDNIELDELTQEPRKLVPCERSQLLSSDRSSSSSQTRDNSEDIMQVLDDYWTMKYRQLMTSS